MRYFRILFLISLSAGIFLSAFTPVAYGEEVDSDNDGLTNREEEQIYKTDIYNRDTDEDGFIDGDEVRYQFDPNKTYDDRLEKQIIVSLKNQNLVYSLGPYVVGDIKISSGKRGYATPKGSFDIIAKLPTVHYRGIDSGRRYSYPNTRWNMRFKNRYYIHGAYWHNNFGTPMSHGCINVSYKDMEPLYNWTDEGTKVTIQ